MGIVLEIKQNKELEKNDIIVYDNGWKVISKDTFLYDLTKEYRDKTRDLEKRVEKLKNNILTICEILKEKNQ